MEKLTRKEIYENRRDYLTARGLCRRCGIVEARKGCATCQACYEKYSAYQKRYLAENKEKMQEYHKEKYKKIVEQKLCPRCKKKVYSVNYIYCRVCREYLCEGAYRRKKRSEMAIKNTLL